MRASLWIRETAANGKRTYRRPNEEKLYPKDTVFCLRYSADDRRRWETLDVANLHWLRYNSQNQKPPLGLTP
jgi:hypothetical protein